MMRNPAEFYKNPFKPVKIRQPADPRLAISQHVGWAKQGSEYTEFSLPEPINYNRAIYHSKYIECAFVKDQVFYLEPKLKVKVSVYYVPQNQLAEFDSWMAAQPHDYLWKYLYELPLKKPRRLLTVRKNLAGITDNERLYTMGYYEKLGSKYFSEDDTMLSERLGPARADILNGAFDGLTSEFDSEASDFDMLI